MGLFRAQDRGASWHDMKVGRFSPLTYARDVCVSPHNPRTLYAFLSTAARSNDGTCSPPLPRLSMWISSVQRSLPPPGPT